VVYHDVPTLCEKRKKRKRERQLTPYRRNLSMMYGTPRTALVPQPILNGILADENRAYIKKHTHLHDAWQFFMLAD
jgi:hypothetical protein